MERGAERPVRVLIVEDHRVVAEALASLLGEDERIDIVGTAGSVADAVVGAIKAEPDVVMMDLRLPDGDGITATRRLRDSGLNVAILFLTADPSDESMMRAVEAGACGYLSKDAGSDELKRFA